MNKPQLVSVVIPTYNRAHVVCNAIDSVLAQTYSHTDVIVVDDGSTDDTKDKLRRYGSCIHVITQSNSGPAIARNRGINAAAGEFVAFLDSDDYWLPNKLAQQIDLLERMGEAVSCCVCNATVRYGDGTTESTFEIADTLPECSAGLWTNPAQVLSSRFVLFNQVAVIRRSVLERIGCFDESLKFYEDYELPLRLALEGPWAVLRDELVVYHAQSQGSWAEQAVQDSVRSNRDLVQMREKVLSLVEGKPAHASVRRILGRELRGSRRELAASRLSVSGLPGAHFVAKSLRRIEWLRRAVCRRTPLYPRMLVQPVALSSVHSTAYSEMQGTLAHDAL